MFLKLGILFLYISLASHTRQTETERGFRLLLLILAAGYFLHCLAAGW